MDCIVFDPPYEESVCYTELSDFFQVWPKRTAGYLYPDDFAECRRVIKPDGIMTVMSNHKSTAAWDALTVALIEAKFAITRIWPVKTEAESRLCAAPSPPTRNAHATPL